MDFLFHKISEKEKEEIKKQVDSILNSFSTKLSNGNLQRVLNSSSNPTEVDSFIEREEFERKEQGKQDESFSREIMFENAPEKNKDAIIAEKKKW
jgi:hypothetical protein